MESLGLFADYLQVLQSAQDGYVGQLRVEYNTSVGRHLVSGEALSAGQLIVRETQTLTVPLSLRSCTCCTGPANGKKCTRCGWPLCISCELSAVKTHSECDLLKNLTTASDHHSTVAEHANILSKRLAVAKCIQLSTERPETFSLIDNLQDNVQQLAKTSWLPSVLRYIVDPIQNACSAAGRHVPSVAKILHLVGIWDTNSFQLGSCNFAGAILLDSTTSPHELTSCTGSSDPTVTDRNSSSVVCPLLALVNHNCQPNANRFVDSQGRLCVVAVRDIAADDPISISYSHTLWNTLMRQTHLRVTKAFTCNCRRCQDFSEFGSMISALACRPELLASGKEGWDIESSCSGYYLVPVGSTEGDVRHADLQCNGCRRRAVPERVQLLLNMLNKSLKQTVMRAVDERSPGRIRRWITKHSALLHDNHVLQSQARFSLVEFVVSTQNLPEASMDELMEVRKDIESLLKLSSTLEPGITRLQGKLYYYHAEVLCRTLPADELGGALAAAEQARRCLKFDGGLHTRIAHLQERLTESVKYQQGSRPTLGLGH